MKAQSLKNGSEPIPGYVLRKRLGAGGYGEVWLADAPGGLQKAIKFIFGTIEESAASSELTSLERIKEVNHPFLLSLERIEVVDGQVMIITELAESSLLDRYDQYRRRGEPGIPRTLLLDFLRDTADGLDFLAQKHSLQHLDVKPGNLLVVADRIKVADFGLVKDLQDQSQSLVSGLTPTYSAPEIFDGRPDFRSDQYSLAIVYMEMLTGQLPFRGSTTAEIARQHLSQQPDLEALPPADRPIVSRALSKNPLDRFGTCRIFVEQLQKVRGAAIPLLPTKQDAQPKTNTEAVQAPQVSAPSSATATQQFKQEFLPAMDRSDAIANYTIPRSMFIGLGGIGCEALVELRSAMMCNCDARLLVDENAWLALDTDAAQIDSAIEGREHCSFSRSQAIQIPIYKPVDYRDADPRLLEPLSRRWLYNIPKSQMTEGVRPIAVLALLDHYEALRSKVATELKNLIKHHENDHECDDPLRIYLLSSLHGGTGSGLLCEIGHMIRQVMSQLNFGNYRICAIASLATTLNSGPASMPSAAALACLSEIRYFMEGAGDHSPLYFQDRADFHSGRPFDWVTLVDGGLHGSGDDTKKAYRHIAESALVDSQTSLAAALAEERVATSGKQLGWLRISGTTPLELADKVDRELITQVCMENAVRNVNTYLSGTTTEEFEESQVQSQLSVSGDIPLTREASEEFTKRLLRDLGILENEIALGEFTSSKEGNDALAGWARRLSSNPQLVQEQLFSDIQTWKSSIANIVHMRMYNWKQVERIQLSVIEGILDFCDHQTDRLVAMFAPFAAMMGSSEQMRESALRYLRAFAQECLRLLSHFQKDGKELSTKVDKWCQSLGASGAGNPDGQIKVSRLPNEFQGLINRVTGVLEKTIHAEAVKILDDAVIKLNINEKRVRPIVPDNLQLPYLMSLAHDLIDKVAIEIDVNFEQIGKTTVSRQDRTIGGKQIHEFGISSGGFGSSVFRFLVAPIEQREIVLEALRKQDLLSSTCILFSTNSLGAYVVCDGQQQHMSQALSNLLRPSPQTLQLAERLRTRVDVEWAPVTELFEIVPTGSEGQPATCPVIPRTPSVATPSAPSAMN